jgi:hypothetical protein
MSKRNVLDFLSRRGVRHLHRQHRTPAIRPVVDLLEDRQLLSLPAISAIQQYGDPSVFAVDDFGNVSYDFLEDVNNEPEWSGWNQIPGGVDATAISTGTVLMSGVTRPYIFMVDSTGQVSYNFQNSSDQWNGWVPVGGDILATSISSGVLPVLNQPFVFAVDTAQNIDFNYLTSNGTWAQWSTIASGAGATAISSGFVQASVSPTAYEPYVFALNTSGNVDYTQRNTAGSWSALQPVGNNLTATAISAQTLHNEPYVFALTTSGSIYSNNLTTASDPVSTAPVKARAAKVHGEKASISAKHAHHKVAKVVQARAHVKARAHSKHNQSVSSASSTTVTWAGWSLVGAGSAPTPASAAPSVVGAFTNYAFALNSAGSVYSTFGTSGLWSSWLNLGALSSGVSAFSIAVTSAPNNNPFAFAIGTDGNVYFVDQTAWATWGTWTSIGAPST